MPGLDHLFGGSSPSSSSSPSNSPGHPSNQGGGGGVAGGWSPTNVPDWRKPKKDKKPFVAGSSGVNVTTQTQQEKDEANEVQHYQNFLSSETHQNVPPGTTWANILQNRKKSAYEASLQNQNQMQQAINLLYTGNPEINFQTNNPITDKEKLQWMKENPGQSWTTTSWIDRAKSNFHYLTDDQKQQIIDSGLAAAESSGILGGTMGAEQVMNDLKKQLQDATTNEEYDDALNSLNSLLGNKTGWMYDDISSLDPESDYVKDWKAKMQSLGLYDPQSGNALGYDQSAVYDWNTDIDVTPKGGKSDYLKNAFYNMQSPDLTPGQYTNYMDTIGAFGHMGTAPGGTGDGSGWGGYYGGYGGGDGGPGGFQYNKHAQQGIAQGPPVNPGSLQEQVNQGFLSGMGAPRFSRGGIVSLLRLGE